jgi:hypothetical protein
VPRTCKLLSNNYECREPVIPVVISEEGVNKVNKTRDHDWLGVKRRQTEN